MPADTLCLFITEFNLVSKSSDPLPTSPVFLLRIAFIKIVSSRCYALFGPIFGFVLFILMKTIVLCSGNRLSNNISCCYHFTNHGYIEMRVGKCAAKVHSYFVNHNFLGAEMILLIEPDGLCSVF